MYLDGDKIVIGKQNSKMNKSTLPGHLMAVLLLRFVLVSLQSEE